MNLPKDKHIQIIPDFKTDTQNEGLKNLGEKMNGDIFNFGLVILYMLTHNAKGIPDDMYKPATYSDKSDEHASLDFVKKSVNSCFASACFSHLGCDMNNET